MRVEVLVLEDFVKTSLADSLLKKAFKNNNTASIVSWLNEKGLNKELIINTLIVPARLNNAIKRSSIYIQNISISN